LRFATAAMLQAAFQWKALAEMAERYALSDDGRLDGQSVQ
jgi:hypothetical protein